MAMMMIIIVYNDGNDVDYHHGYDRKQVDRRFSIQVWALAALAGLTSSGYVFAKREGFAVSCTNMMMHMRMMMMMMVMMIYVDAKSGLRGHASALVLFLPKLAVHIKLAVHLKRTVLLKLTVHLKLIVHL